MLNPSGFSRPVADEAMSGWPTGTQKALYKEFEQRQTMKQDGTLDILDLLDGVRGNTAYNDRTDLVARELLARANELREHAANLPPEAMAVIRSAIEAYAPWEEGADRTLLQALTELDSAVAAPSRTQSNYDHPFRRVPVRTCLSEMKKIFETSYSAQRCWTLSQPAAQLSGKKLFLDYAWSDWRQDYAGQAKALRATLQHYSKDSVWIGTPHLLVRRSCIA